MLNHELSRGCVTVTKTESISVARGISRRGITSFHSKPGAEVKESKGIYKSYQVSAQYKRIKWWHSVILFSFTAVKISQVCTKETICAVGKNSCWARTRQRFRNAAGGSHVPSPWPVPKTTTSTKMWKILQRKLGRGGGGTMEEALRVNR